jgi:hypothetical protein
LRNRVRLFPERRECLRPCCPCRFTPTPCEIVHLIAAFADICQRHACEKFFALKKLKKNVAALTFVIAAAPQNF